MLFLPLPAYYAKSICSILCVSLVQTQKKKTLERASFSIVITHLRSSGRRVHSSTRSFSVHKTII